MKTNGQMLFVGGGGANVFLAIFAGVITGLPLILFHKGNQLLNLTTASLLFYINPTAQLLLGVGVFSEQFFIDDLMAFGLIWVGIAVYFQTRRRVSGHAVSDL